ncbi:c-type cytochrome [Halocynthiibacter styelae]|uniref:C-type cytochrome n=1 Tax=Halocynthiibacter styelae TaxID=2761955 RepID=A0A8J7IQ73_9RHOB|nr:c-type cytochrome [Paenihalocynthiibacter styelae]MBI1493251.1 c-type cytochrome [Paenihalocynthiibacter styelae]
MNRTIFLTAALALAPLTAFAEGDAAAGERAFNRCKSCHAIADGDNVIVRGGRTGPNLFGVIGRAAASVEGFRYSAGIKAAAENGLVWDQENIQAYAEHPTNYLRELNDDASLRSPMAPQRFGDSGPDLAAFLASHSPAPAEAAEPEAEATEEAAASE